MGKHKLILHSQFSAYIGFSSLNFGGVLVSTYCELIIFARRGCLVGHDKLSRQQLNATDKATAELLAAVSADPDAVLAQAEAEIAACEDVCLV